MPTLLRQKILGKILFESGVRQAKAAILEIKALLDAPKGMGRVGVLLKS